MKTHEINLKIHDESELYVTLDPYQNTLSQETVDYLTRVILNKHNKPNDRYIINVISDTPIDEQHAVSCIRGEVEQKKKGSGLMIKNLTLKEMFLGLIGAIILGVWLYLSVKFETVAIEILCIMGWVAIWEATSIAIMERPELISHHKGLNKLLEADIRFYSTEDFLKKLINHLRTCHLDGFGTSTTQRNGCR